MSQPTTTIYDNGYQAGLCCDPIPDDAPDEWMLGYGAALDVDTFIADTLHGLLSPPARDVQHDK